MPRGEKRKGGRPKGSKSKHTLEKETAREIVRQKVFAHLEPLLDAQLNNAKGIKYLVVRDKKGGKFIRVTEAMAKARAGDTEETIEVWEKDPSIQAFTDLMNRALDKPMEQPQTHNVNLPGTEALLARMIAARKRASGNGGSKH